jgi:HEAT repeat protein
VQRNAVRTRLDAEGKPEPAWRRPVGELEQIGARSIPPLLEALRILRDETTVYPCILALAAIADSSRIEQELLAAGGGQEGIRFQARLVKVLGNIQDPAAVNRLMEVLSGTYDWQVRATAAEVLGAYRGALEGQVRVCLETARKDKDLFVASKAEKALKSLNP